MLTFRRLARVWLEDPEQWTPWVSNRSEESCEDAACNNLERKSLDLTKDTGELEKAEKKGNQND